MVLQYLLLLATALPTTSTSTSTSNRNSNSNINDTLAAHLLSTLTQPTAAMITNSLGKASGPPFHWVGVCSVLIDHLRCPAICQSLPSVLPLGLWRMHRPKNRYTHQQKPGRDNKCSISALNATSAGPAFFGFPVLNSPEKCGVVIPGQEVSRASSLQAFTESVLHCGRLDFSKRWTCVQRSRPKGAPPSMRNKMQCLGDSSLSIKNNIATPSCLRSANLPNTSHSSGQCICKRSC